MIKIAVCEDDNTDRQIIQEYIEQYVKEKNQELNQEFCLRLFESAEEFLESKFYPDIIFLDIFMHGKNGIQLGWEIKNSNFNTILIYTSYLEEKMITALNHIHSFGFLLKPIEKNQIDKMLNDAIDEIDKLMFIHTVTFVSENNTLISLSAMDIYYFEYCRRKIKIVTKDGVYICKNEKIKTIANKMELYGFIMSHQSFVVNLYQVERFTTQELIMKNGDTVYLAQKRASAVRKKLIQIIQERVKYGGSY